jgi:hypothetical protein
MKKDFRRWRLVVVGGHTRSIGKTQLVCDVIAAFPEARWLAGKITQYGHGVCAQNGHDCDCAPDEHICALSWEQDAGTGTDSSRFLAAGAERSFWLRTKQGYLAEGLPVLRGALASVDAGGNGGGVARTAGRAEQSKPLALIVESNSLMQFLKPSLFFAVLDPAKEDFKDSARAALDRADALVIRGDGMGGGEPPWMKLPARLLRDKPAVRQGEREPLPRLLDSFVKRVLEAEPGVLI